MDLQTAQQNFDAAHREKGEATRAYIDAVQVNILTGRTSPDVSEAKSRLNAADIARTQAATDLNDARECAARLA